MRNRTAQEKVLALEQQVLMLTKELKAQKVSSGPREAPGSGALVPLDKSDKMRSQVEVLKRPNCRWLRMLCC